MKARHKTGMKAAHPLISTRGKVSILQKVRGMWKKRKPDPIRQLHSMRQEWER